MSQALLLLTACGLALVGFGALALAMPRHWRDVTGVDCDEVPARIALRCGGGAAIAVSVVIWWSRDGPAFGSLLALLCASASAVMVAQVLAWRPHWLRPLLLKRTSKPA